MSTIGPVAGFVRDLFAVSTEERHAQREALSAFRDALRLELDRSRRYERRFVLLAADLAASRTGEARANLAAKVERTIRSADRYCVTDRVLYLLLPEVDADAAERALERILEGNPGAADDRSVAIAAFPDDGVTMGSLLAILRHDDVARRRRIRNIGHSDPPSESEPASTERAV